MASNSIQSAFFTRRCISSLYQCHSRPQISTYLIPALSARYASQKTSKGSKTIRKKNEPRKKKKARTTFIREDLRDAAIQFSLYDAIRYIHAFEVGQKPTSPKYELAISLNTKKNGPVIRNRLRLPHAVDTSQRICVICPPDSKIAEQAIAAGASLVGEESVFDAVKDGRVEFERCIAHVDSVAKLNKSGIARVLGPKSLFPNVKTGTVVKDVATSVRDLRGGSVYRERMGVIRMAIGQLGFTAEEVQANIRAFMDALKKDINLMSDKVAKDIHEVVLSSTNSPGFSLSGDLKSPESISSAELNVL